MEWLNTLGKNIEEKDNLTGLVTHTNGFMHCTEPIVQIICDLTGMEVLVYNYYKTNGFTDEELAKKTGETGFIYGRPKSSEIGSYNLPVGEHNLEQIMTGMNNGIDKNYSETKNELENINKELKKIFDYKSDKHEDDEDKIIVIVRKGNEMHFVPYGVDKLGKKYNSDNVKLEIKDCTKIKECTNEKKGIFERIYRVDSQPKLEGMSTKEKTNEDMPIEDMPIG